MKNNSVLSKVGRCVASPSSLSLLLGLSLLTTTTAQTENQAILDSNSDAIDFLESTGLPEGEYAARRWAQKESAFVELDRKADMLPDLTEVYIGIVDNQEQDSAIRGYALQHLYHIYRKVNETDKASIKACLWENTLNTDDHVAATALLVLNNLSDRATIDRAELGSRASSMVGDASRTEGARATAMAVAGACGAEDLSSRALSLLSDSTASTVLRMASAAALGNVGSRALVDDLRHVYANLAEGPVKRVLALSISKIETGAR